MSGTWLSRSLKAGTFMSKSTPKVVRASTSRSGVSVISLSSVMSKAAMAAFDYRLAVADANRCFVGVTDEEEPPC